MIKEKTKITLIGGSKYFLIPSELLSDSTFPFNISNEELIMEITEGIIIIKKREEK